MTVLETAEKWLPAGPRLVRAVLAEGETACARRMAAIAFALRVVGADAHALMPRPEAVRP